MENIFIPCLNLVKCTFKKKTFFEKISSDDIIAINTFLNQHNIILHNNLVLTKTNFKLLIIDENNTKYTQYEEQIGNNKYNTFTIKNILDHIILFQTQQNKLNDEYLSALNNITIETECLQSEINNYNNNNIQLTEYLSDASSEESTDSININTVDFSQIDTLINI